MCCPHCCTHIANAGQVQVAPSDHRDAASAPAPWWQRLGAGLGLGVGAILLMAVLAATVPALFGWSSITVLGSSMGRELPVGSVAVTKKVPADRIRTADVILFSSAGGGVPTLHRVIRFETVDGKRVAVTKGDSNATEDTTPVAMDRSGSVVQYHVPFLGYLFAALANNARFILFLFAPLALLWLWPVRDKSTATLTASAVAPSDSST